MPKPVDPEVAAHERALREVGETMLMIEAAITRVDKALSALRRESEPDRQARAGLIGAKRYLEGLGRGRLKTVACSPAHWALAVRRRQRGQPDHAQLAEDWGGHLRQEFHDAWAESLAGLMVGATAYWAGCWVADGA